MKIRKVVSLTAALSFLVVLLNSVALYIAPHGRVAYWVDWRFLGLTKAEWANQHIVVGLLFLIALCLHIYYNWTPIVAYLKNKARQITVFTRDFNIALALTIVFTVGAYMEVVPFSWVPDFSESIKNSVAEKHGDPPYGRAENATMEAFAERMGFDLEQSRVQLEQAGIKVDTPSQTLLEIARRNRTSPQRLLEILQPREKPASSVSVFPADPPQGFGRLSLSEVCEKYGLIIDEVLAAFEAQELSATPSATIKEIAEQHGVSSAQIFTTIKDTAKPIEAD